MADTRLLEIKKQKKAQKPAFLRRNFMKNKRSRVSGAWRAPIGVHNKLRRRRRGIGQWVMPGYRVPVAVRGFTREGLRPLVVENVEQMRSLDPATDIAILKGSSGKKNRILMVQEAVKKKISILNIKDPSAFLQACENEKAQKKVQKKAPEQKKTEEKKEEKKKSDASEEKTIDEIAKDHKKEEQKQKNKILTKKE